MSTKWTMVARGSWEAPQMRVFTNCNCGHCPAWVASVTDETGYEVDRWEAIRTREEAKACAEQMLADWNRESADRAARAGGVR